MADTAAMADIRSLDIDRVAKGFADEAIIFKQYCTVQSTSAREIRWFQKTAGIVDTATTTAITASNIYNAASKALPAVAEQSWTRNTSYVKKFMVESPLLSEEDLKDNDVTLLATTVRDLTRSVAWQVDYRIIQVLTEAYSPSNIQTGAAVADGWDDDVTGDPISDILSAKQAIRAYGYNPEGAVMVLNSIDFKNLIRYLITVKGSSIPNFSSDAVRTGAVMEILGLKVVVSENFATDYALVFVPNTAITWKSFMPIQAVTIDDPGIGKKIRVWEQGEAILTDPKAVYLITDTVV